MAIQRNFFLLFLMSQTFTIVGLITRDWQNFTFSKIQTNIPLQSYLKSLSLDILLREKMKIYFLKNEIFLFKNAFWRLYLKVYLGKNRSKFLQELRYHYLYNIMGTQGSKNGIFCKPVHYKLQSCFLRLKGEVWWKLISFILFLSYIIEFSIH